MISVHLNESNIHSTWEPIMASTNSRKLCLWLSVFSLLSKAPVYSTTVFPAQRLSRHVVWWYFWLHAFVHFLHLLKFRPPKFLHTRWCLANKFSFICSRIICTICLLHSKYNITEQLFCYRCVCSEDLYFRNLGIYDEI